MFVETRDVMFSTAKEWRNINYEKDEQGGKEEKKELNREHSFKVLCGKVRRMKKVIRSNRSYNIVIDAETLEKNK